MTHLAKYISELLRRSSENGESFHITEGMLRAGVDAFDYDPRVEDLSEAIIRVYLAMRLVESKENEAQKRELSQ